MPADIDIPALAAATGQSEADLTWLLTQLRPGGSIGGLQLSGSPAPIALADDGASGISITTDYVVRAAIAGRAVTILPLAGCEISFGVAANDETLTFTMGATTIAVTLDNVGTRLDTIAALYDYLRNTTISRRRV